MRTSMRSEVATLFSENAGAWAEGIFIAPPSTATPDICAGALALQLIAWKAESEREARSVQQLRKHKLSRVYIYIYIYRYVCIRTFCLT